MSVFHGLSGGKIMQVPSRARQLILAGPEAQLLPATRNTTARASLATGGQLRLLASVGRSAVKAQTRVLAPFGRFAVRAQRVIE